MALILIVEDDGLLRSILADAVKSAGYEVAQVGDGEEAVKAARESKPDLILLDWRLPGISGTDVMEQIDGRPPIIVMSGYIDEIRSDIKARAHAVIEKPVTVDRLLKEVSDAFADSATGHALRDTKEDKIEMTDSQRAKATERYERANGGG